MLLREWLIENRISQLSLSKAIGCTPAMLNYIVNGKNSNVKIDLLRRISRTTGIGESDLISDFLECSDRLIDVKKTMPVDTVRKEIQINFSSF